MMLPARDFKELPMLNFNGAWHFDSPGEIPNTGGVFLREIPRNIVILGHRGIVTLGHGRVPKGRLFAEMFTTIRDTSGGSDEFLLIGDLDSRTLVDDLDPDCAGLPEALIKPNSPIPAPPASRVKRCSHSSASTLMSIAAKSYYRADRGQSLIVITGPLFALSGMSSVRSRILKNQAIDLTVIMAKRVYLFDVKTSSRPQHIYFD